jgi:hypothetical protein
MRLVRRALLSLPQDRQSDKKWLFCGLWMNKSAANGPLTVGAALARQTSAWI